MKLNRLIGLAVAGVFATTAHAQFQVITNFTATQGSPKGPVAPGIIAQGRSGNLLTSTPNDGRYTGFQGMTFRVTPSGAVTTLHKFNGWDGTAPYSGLTLGRDGRFYGATNSGGAHGFGTIFKMRWDGKITTLRDFNGGDEAYPIAPPVQSLHGEFYGTTLGQGSAHHGVIYKVDSWGTYTVLHTFNGLDGDDVETPLVQGTDYWFYGVSKDGGYLHYGTIFRISPTGEFQRLYVFDGRTHGEGPISLIQGTDGNFYGMTYQGGGCDAGVVFKMTPSRQVTVMHTFCGDYGDGSAPYGGLVQATDGNLYGVTAGGGFSRDGVIFRISTSGQFTLLHNFDRTHGVGPMNLMLHTNGFLYGETAGGGSHNSGTVFRYNLGLPPFITFVDVYGSVGQTVEIIGQGFTNDTKLFFHGVRAQITELTPTYLRVVVPKGATTGWITATTTFGTLKSDKVFTVRP